MYVHYALRVGQQKLGLGWPQCCFALHRSINSRLIVKFLTYLTSQLLTPCLHVFKYLTGVKTIHFLCTSLSRCNKQQGMIYKNWVKNDSLRFLKFPFFFFLSNQEIQRVGEILNDVLICKNFKRAWIQNSFSLYLELDTKTTLYYITNINRLK